MARSLTIATGLLFAAAFGSEARAAVRVCKPVVVSEIMTRASERDAKKAALDGWKAGALQHGPGYDSWRIAINKRLRCARVGTSYQCLAAASPCLIEQVAPPLPPSRAPRKSI